MPSCPDCIHIEAQTKGNNQFEIVDIGRNVRALKDFLNLRDNNPAFDHAKAHGQVGIPCFVLSDGMVTLTPEDVGLTSRPAIADGAFCPIDGSGC